MIVLSERTTKKLTIRGNTMKYPIAIIHDFKE